MKICVKTAKFSQQVVNQIEASSLRLKRNFSLKEIVSNINKQNRRKDNNSSLKNLNQYSTMFRKIMFEEKKYNMILKMKHFLNLLRQNELKLLIFLVLFQIQERQKTILSLQLSLRYLRLLIKTMVLQICNNEKSFDIFSFNHSLFISLFRYYRVTQNCMLSMHSC